MVNIFELFGKKSVLEIMNLFLKNPTREIYSAKIQRETKLSKKVIFDVVREIERFGLITAKQVGRIKMYNLNRDNPIVKQLKILLTISYLLPALRKLKEKEQQVFLFGSAARGEDVETSDIDLLVIGKLKRSEIMHYINEIKEIPSERLKVVVFSPMEYSQLRKKDPAFYERIEKDKIRLV
jgi:predicted nucleotidyltransferase